MNEETERFINEIVIENTMLRAALSRVGALMLGGDDDLEEALAIVRQHAYDA